MSPDALTAIAIALAFTAFVVFVLLAGFVF